MKPRRVVSRVEFHPGELFPRVGFIVTNRSLPNERVPAFYNGRGTAGQHIKEGKYALKWTRLSCMRFAANAVRLQLHALAYNPANFLRTLANEDDDKIGLSSRSIRPCYCSRIWHNIHILVGRNTPIFIPSFNFRRIGKG